MFGRFDHRDGEARRLDFVRSAMWGKSEREWGREGGTRGGGRVRSDASFDGDRVEASFPLEPVRSLLEHVEPKPDSLVEGRKRRKIETVELFCLRLEESFVLQRIRGFSRDL